MSESPPDPMDPLALVPVVPVVVIERLADAVPVARALAAGGLPVVELTLRTPVALEAIAAISAEVPDVVVGAGTITAPAQAQEAVDAGARFLVSPGATPRLLAGMHATGAPFLPGTATVSEVLAVLETGQQAMKFFPAELSGGTGYLRAVGSVAPQARFCPTGGITPATAADYLALPNVGCVGGSWLTPAPLVAAADWAGITDLARAAASLRS
ncbi:bifunctional 4-hydroxy-2-oxoglutarate aldolase/2-dehydro-3-deoxy-phosphogluconate aldolase [Nocardioides sp.]|uniref:bifunctional 4-hydroxy-2-oxoglutarate aldolase/2-dehydro-3-deoxy-phosphogluconate aldolase n=1 Tax=Nocardioides sp. TaxID=35761 RepID=UPI0035147BD1